MENRLSRPPHGNFDVDFRSLSSRERKSPTLYQPGALSESNLQYYPRRESYQRNTNFHSGAHIQDDTRGLSFNQAKATPLGHQFERDQFPNQNVSLGSWLNCNGNSNFHVNRTKNIHNTSSHEPREPLGHEGDMQAGASVVETWQTQVGPGEAYKSFPFLKSNNLSSVGAAPLGSSLCLEQVQNPISSQNAVQVQGDDSVKTEETKKASDMKNLLCPLPKSSPKNFSPASTVDSGQKKDHAQCSPASDEKSVSQLGKPASIVAEKLWDGSVQLSPSVLVSAVAFFKSGEKLLDTNWSESIEVKGKVRLEAFEKYIQDLPRSRNRGLMVISLCWKKGSSETGLTGMKEVAKGYKKGGRVGRAPLSPGIDLYICPRSDTIITILAKYGFFKGMSVVEDNPDSMIGCVVWRKSQTSSNFVEKKPESKSNSLSEKPPLNFPSLSPLQQAAEIEKSCLIAQPVQESEKRNVSESKKQIEIGSTVDGPEQLKTSLELKTSIMNKITSSLDNDDLPEFDFKTACGTSRTNMTANPSASVLLDNRLLAKGTQNLLAMSVSSAQRSDHSKLPSTANEGMTTLRKIRNHEPKIPVFSNAGERSSVQDNATTTLVSATVFSNRKNIFDDDDDMPEWCPPERSFSETVNRSATFPSELQTPTFQTLALGPPRSVPFSPPPNATRPPFSSQGFPLNAPQSRPFKRGPISSTQPNYDSILGSPPSFEAKVPFYPPEKRRRHHS